MSLMSAIFATVVPSVKTLVLETEAPSLTGTLSTMPVMVERRSVMLMLPDREDCPRVMTCTCDSAARTLSRADARRVLCRSYSSRLTTPSLKSE